MSVLEQVEGLVSAKLSVIKNLLTLVRLEARLAGLSIFPLLLNLCLLIIIISTVWLSTMVLLGVGLFSVLNNALLSISVVLLLNLGLLFGLLKYLTYNLKNLSFEKTRAYFSNKESTHYDKLEKTNKSPNRTHRQNIKKPATHSDEV